VRRSLRRFASLNLGSDLIRYALAKDKLLENSQVAADFDGTAHVKRILANQGLFKFNLQSYF
jgi:hypothetical protein